jgi:hypothetical protein
MIFQVANVVGLETARIKVAVKRENPSDANFADWRQTGLVIHDFR